MRFDEEDAEIYEAEWSVREEIVFLNSIANHGLYKWRYVAGAVTRKTPKNCEDHFYLVHRILNSPAKKDHPNELALTKFQDSKASKELSCETVKTNLNDAPGLGPKDSKLTELESLASNTDVLIPFCANELS